MTAKRSRVEGGKQAAANFRALAKFVTGPARSATKASLQPTLAAAQRNVLEAPKRTGLLQRSLVLKLDRDSAKTKPRYLVGVDPKASHGGMRAVRYAALVEFGTHQHSLAKGASRLKNRRQGSGGMHPGTRSFGFMRRAYHETKDEAVAIFGRLIGPALEKRAAQLGKKR